MATRGHHTPSKCCYWKVPRLNQEDFLKAKNAKKKSVKTSVITFVTTNKKKANKKIIKYLPLPDLVEVKKDFPSLFRWIFFSLTSRPLTACFSPGMWKPLLQTRTRSIQRLQLVNDCLLVRSKTRHSRDGSPHCGGKRRAGSLTFELKEKWLSVKNPHHFLTAVH